MARVVYADEAVGPYKLYRRPTPLHRLGLFHGRGADGYGSKITTDIVLKFDQLPRLYRVYCTVFSNNGSNWILKNKERLYLKTHFQDEVLPESQLPGRTPRRGK